MWVRSGSFHGYYIVVPEDCVGGPFKDLHEAALKNFRQYYGTVTDSKALAALWANAARQPLRELCRRQAHFEVRFSSWP